MAKLNYTIFIMVKLNEVKLNEDKINMVKLS
jgi:hypothetical protein